MPQNLFRDQETGLGEEFKSRFKEIQKDHGGKFLAVIDSDEILVNANYVKLLREIEKKDIDLESVTITNVPPTEEWNGFVALSFRSDHLSKKFTLLRKN